MGEVVLPDRNHVGLAEEDIAGLVNRVGQEQPGQGMAAGLHLGLDRRIAMQFGLRHQGEEGEHELILGWSGRVGEDHGLAGVDAGRQVVQDEVEDVVLHVLGGIAVGDDLIVGDDDIGMDPSVLHLDALADGAEIVAQVETPRGPVSGQHRVLSGVLLQLGQDLVRQLFGGFEALADLIACRCDLLFALHGPALVEMPKCRWKLLLS